MSEAVMEYSSEKKCPVCGKKFDVPWPHQWAFKRRKPNSSNYYFYCSWKCIRELEKKGEDKHMGAKKILTEAQENTAIAMAIKGEDPRPYLEECGMKDGQSAWSHIRVKLRDNNPELFEKLPKVLGHKKRGPKNAETAEAEPAQDFQEATDEFLKECEEITLKVKADRPKITRPVSCDGFEFGAAKSTETGFRYEYSAEYDLFSVKAKGDELTMSLENMRALIRELPKAAAVLGVEL